MSHDPLLFFHSAAAAVEGGRRYVGGKWDGTARLRIGRGEQRPLRGLGELLQATLSREAHAYIALLCTAARTALKRKKAHEHSLEQTSNQITMLENQIYSIESANINQETLNAMRNAGKAMKDIHGNLNIEKVDSIM